ALSAHRRILVPARRYADRRVLANGHVSKERVVAGSGSAALSRTRLRNHFTQPCVQSLGCSDSLSPVRRFALDRPFATTAGGKNRKCGQPAFPNGCSLLQWA